MPTWLFTIDKDFGQHWDIARENLVWDTPKKVDVHAGDQIYFWLSQQGFVGRPWHVRTPPS